MSHPTVRIKDGRSECWSIMATMNAPLYMTLVESAYKDQGGIEGQRQAIKSKSGLKIRSRLVQDIKRGTVIPPIVIGIVCNEDDYTSLSEIKDSEELIKELLLKNYDVSIIDGMQRTTALKEAGSIDNMEVRVEVWLSHKVDSLIYRMLVLNTGQVPWDLKRQLDVLYKPMLRKVEEKVKDIRVISVDDNSRRSQAGVYRSSRIIELFLAFTSRSIDVDIKDRMADEFAKIDITEASSQNDYFPIFLKSISFLVDIDAQFDRIGRGVYEADDNSRIRVGRDIFTSAPASIGFIVAVATYVFGDPGFDYNLSEADSRITTIDGNINRLIKYMGDLSPEELIGFVDLATLNEVLGKGERSSRIGEIDRIFYQKAFFVLISKTDQIIQNGNMYPCWRVR